MKNRLPILLAFVAVSAIGCDLAEPRPAIQVDPSQAKARAAEIALLVAVVEGSSPTNPVPDGPSPSPSSDICDNCNGRGEVGDSRHMFPCEPCGGTGRVVRARASSESCGPPDETAEDDDEQATSDTSEPAKSATGYRTVTDAVSGITADRPTIVMISRQNCPPCDRWLVTDAPAYDRNGWEVTKVDISTTNGAPAGTPSFRVFDGKRWHGFDGYMTFGDCRRLLGLEAEATPATQRLANGPRQYSHTWTWPRSHGGIADHLMNAPNHRLSREALIGKSQLELEELHSRLHRGEVTRGMVQQSACPSCATVRTRR